MTNTREDTIRNARAIIKIARYVARSQGAEEGLDGTALEIHVETVAQRQADELVDFLARHNTRTNHAELLATGRACQ